MSRLHVHMMRLLIGDIIGGVLPEGALLPKDALLGEQFRVSRSVARECIRALEERGLVHVTHGSGARVTRPSQWHRFDPDVLATLLADPDRRDRARRDYLECQQVLLVQAAGLAAERASTPQLETLAETFAQMKTAGRAASANAAAERRFRDSEIVFYLAISEATGNTTLRRLLEPVCRAAPIQPDTAPQADWYAQTLTDHRQTLNAIGTHDSDSARERMATRLATVKAALSTASR